MGLPNLPDLPIAEVLPALLDALTANASAVLVAPPGAGKTTLVPLALLGASWLGGGKIVLLEPRRLAARAAAGRMASLLGEEPGATVGYAMRMESRTSARTKILVVTEGVLSRMILDDPELPGVSVVLFDEFHERSLDGDFGLALALDVQRGLRPDLRLLVMSATLDGARVARLLDGAPVIESEGRSFPVEIRYRERAAGLPVEDAMAAAIRDSLAAEPGSILAFLPGQREITRTAERLAERLPAGVDIVPLSGQMDAKAQDGAVRAPPPGKRKVVLATSVAETSLTIDAIRVVIDSGLARLPSYEPASGLTRLRTVRVSRASAEQRAGRAGRTAPGVAIRLWRSEQTAALLPFAPPEILAADLSGLLLDCADFGIADPAALRFLDPPPGPALAEARTLLRCLGAVDTLGRLTPTGLAMRKLPLPVRLAHMVVRAAERGLAGDAAELAVLIAERGLGGDGADLDRRLARFRSERSPRAQAARQLAKRLARSMQEAPPPPCSLQGNDRRAAPSHPLTRAAAGAVKAADERRRGSSGAASGLGALLVHAWPDRIARRRGERGRFLLANGGGAMVDGTDPLADEEFLVVVEIQGRAQDARITAAAAATETEIRHGLAERLERRIESAFDAAKGVVRVRETVRLGAIVLSEGMLPPPTGGEANQAVIAALRAHGLALLPWNSEAATLRQRLLFLHRSLGPPWPDVSEGALARCLEEWLSPYLPGEASLARIEPARLRAALLALVPPGLQRQLDRLAPMHFAAPSGSLLPIRYDGEQPVLPARVQELFGLDKHPAVADGRVPITLELHSPAHRPIQITRDLPGFWRGSWDKVRAEMRGRYPRHPWPEDPMTAAATSRAKPRGR